MMWHNMKYTTIPMKYYNFKILNLNMLKPLVQCSLTELSVEMEMFFIHAVEATEHLKYG